MSGGGPTFVQRTAFSSNSTQNLSCALTSAIATGDIGIVTAAVYNGSGVSISSITNATVIDNGGGGHANVLAAGWVTAGVSSVTVNTSAAGSYVYIEVDEYSGLNTSTPVDKHTAPGLASTATTCSPSGLTPTQAGDLAIEYVANFSVSSSPAQGTYATSPSTTTTIEGNSSGGILALEGWSDYTGTSAITGTWTWSAAQAEQCGFLLLNPAPNPTGPTFVQRTACGSNATQNLSCTLTSAIATGDIGIVTAAVYNGAGVSISSITNATVIDNGGGGHANVLAAGWVGAGVSSVTVNTSAAGSYVYVEVDEYSGVDTTTPVDKHAAPGLATSATTCSPSALTPTQTGDLAIEYVANFTVSSSAAQGTYATSPSTTTTIEGNSSGGILALEGWSDYTGTSAITGTWTWSAAQAEQCGFLLLNPSTTSSSAYSYTNYVNIVNGQEFPSNFEPYCANTMANSSAPCPWNDALPSSPQKLLANSSTIVANIWNGVSNNLLFPNDWSMGGDFNHPVYLASSTDPEITVTASYGNVSSPQAFRIPSAARAAGYFCYALGQDCNGNSSSALDGHMAVIEPDGTEWDMYHADTYSGSNFSVSGLFLIGNGTAGIGGPGVCSNLGPSPACTGGGATNGAALAAGMISEQELNNGVIPHALFASTNCTTGSYVYPAGAPGAGCTSGGSGPPQGARLQLTLTDSQINGMTGADPWMKTILHAMHDYGVYLLDTQGGAPSPGGVYLRLESQTQYASYDCVNNYTLSCYPMYTYGSPSGIVYNDTSTFDSLQYNGIKIWSSTYWQIVDPCYALETCTQ